VHHSFFLNRPAHRTRPILFFKRQTQQFVEQQEQFQQLIVAPFDQCLVSSSQQ